MLKTSAEGVLRITSNHVIPEIPVAIAKGIIRNPPLQSRRRSTLRTQCTALKEGIPDIFLRYATENSGMTGWRLGYFISRKSHTMLNSSSNPTNNPYFLHTPNKLLPGWYSLCTNKNTKDERK